jgi:hypothetical protein
LFEIKFERHDELRRESIKMERLRMEIREKKEKLRKKSNKELTNLEGSIQPSITGEETQERI